MKLKMIAIAAAAASLAGAAHADLTSGTSVNNGSVALLAVDITTNNWYIRDTGFFLNDFIPNSVTPAVGDNGGVPGNKTPEAGLVLNSTNTPSFADNTFSSWFTAQTSTGGVSNVRWLLTGYDLNGNVATNTKRLVTSSANPNETILNGQLDNYVATGAGGGLFNLFDQPNNPLASEFSNTGIGGAAGFLNAFGLGTDAMTLVGSSASMFYASRGVPTGTTSGNTALTKFGNSAGFASALLESNGDFSYTLAPAAAVPLPAAAWMMGAGLLAIGGMVRRRRAEAQA